MANNLTWGGARGFNLKITFVTSCSLGSSSCSFVCLCVCENVCLRACSPARTRVIVCVFACVCERGCCRRDTIIRHLTRRLGNWLFTCILFLCRHKSIASHSGNLLLGALGTFYGKLKVTSAFDRGSAFICCCSWLFVLNPEDVLYY